MQYADQERLMQEEKNVQRQIKLGLYDGFEIKSDIVELPIDCLILLYHQEFIIGTEFSVLD